MRCFVSIREEDRDLEAALEYSGFWGVLALRTVIWYDFIQLARRMRRKSLMFEAEIAKAV